MGFKPTVSIQILRTTFDCWRAGCLRSGAYLKNAAGQDAHFSTAAGMLLYPCARSPLDERFIIQGHPVTIATVDFSATWTAIETRLLALVCSS